MVMADDYGAQRWMELAACLNDDRFTGVKPSASESIEMLDICFGCEVFQDCLRYHDYSDVIGVFAAGWWREGVSGCSLTGV